MSSANTTDPLLTGSSSSSSGYLSGSAYQAYVAQSRSDREGAIKASQSIVLTSVVLNVGLLVVMASLFFLTGSMTILASFADSIVDLVSQAVLALADRASERADRRYPVGRARLSAVAVIISGGIMMFAVLEVMQESAIRLYRYISYNETHPFRLAWWMYAILAAGMAVKLVVFFLCLVAVKATGGSSTLKALALDAKMDLLAMTWTFMMIAGATAAPKYLDYLDPLGGLLISLIGLRSWVTLIWQQVGRLVGQTAPASFLALVEGVVAEHHPELLLLDQLKAYHFGDRYLVEIEVVMPATMTVKQSHDIALVLQNKIEDSPQVERRFVHVDYCKRAHPEHKVDAQLLRKEEADVIVGVV